MAVFPSIGRWYALFSKDWKMLRKPNPFNPIIYGCAMRQAIVIYPIVYLGEYAYGYEDFFTVG